MIWFTKDNLIFLHDQLIDKFGGMKGIRDEGILESLIELPFLKFDGKELYPTPLEKIIRFSYSLTVNHCFFDGNKRIGAFALVFLLEHNGYKIEFTNEELIKIFLAVGESKLNYLELLSYLREKIR